MPMPSHMIVKGEKQGEMKGDVTMKGREGTILVTAFDHEVSMPVDPLSGLSQGKRLHRPLKITKPIDPASPMLYYALASAERCDVTIKWYRQAGAVEQHYFTTTLAKAQVVNIKEFYPSIYDEETAKYGHQEEVSFTYEKIIWRHETDKKESEDSWQQPFE